MPSAGSERRLPGRTALFTRFFVRKNLRSGSSDLYQKSILPDLFSPHFVKRQKKIKAFYRPEKGWRFPATPERLKHG